MDKTHNLILEKINKYKRSRRTKFERLTLYYNSYKVVTKPELVCKELANRPQAPSYVAAPNMPLANHNAINYGPFTFPLTFIFPLSISRTSQ